MTTINAVDVGLSGQTGSGAFVGATSPTLVTPLLGNATATSVRFDPTTEGIIGTLTNDSAATGVVGEFISSVIPQASPVTLTGGVPANVTSISLTQGDWDIMGNVVVSYSGATIQTLTTVWTSTTSASIPDISLTNFIDTGVVGADASYGLSTPFFRASLAGTSNVYLSVNADFASGTAIAFGGIYARRVR